jgi:sulfonate transport system substrate-binding protein
MKVNTMKKKSLLGAITAGVVALALSLTGCASTPAPAATLGSHQGETLNIDWATYNPLSILIKNNGWLEESLASSGIKVNWVQSLSSADANKKLLAGAIDVGSTAGSAALLARSNGSQIKTLEIFDQPEWAALAVGPNSTITKVSDLKGKKVAATKGTDPYFFLLQALEKEGVDVNSVEIVNVPHADGKTALLNGSVDAWAGLDPILAGAQTQGVKLIYRNVGFNSYGFLNGTESFINKSPDVAQYVVNAYEKARQYAIANPDKTYQALATAASLAVDVAKTVIVERTVINIDPIPGQTQTDVLAKIGKVFVANGDVATQGQVDTALKTLYETKFIKIAFANIDKK